MQKAMAICLWFDGKAEAAARFYTQTFPDARIDAIRHAPGDYPAGRAGDVLTVEFTICGTAFLALNGGGGASHSQAVSFQIFTDTQGETARLWDAIVGHGGEALACSWCRDRWGIHWQIVPRILTAALADPDPAVRARAFTAMMGMTRIDIAAIAAAIGG